MNLGWIPSGPGQLLLFRWRIAFIISRSLRTMLHRESLPATRWGHSGKIPLSIVNIEHYCCWRISASSESRVKVRLLWSRFATGLEYFVILIIIVKKCLELLIFLRKFSFFKNYFALSYFSLDKFAIILVLSKVTFTWIIFIFFFKNSFLDAN